MIESASITAITPCQRVAGTLKIIVGKRTMARLSPRAVESLGLTVGQPWDDGLANQVLQTAEYESLLRQAAKWVDRKMFSRAELAEKLTQASDSIPMQKRVLDRLTELGLIDDMKLGQLLIEHTQRKSPAGPALLRSKLAARKLPESVIEQLLEHSKPEATQGTAAMIQEARKRLATMAGLAPATQGRRLAGWLNRQGHDPDAIAQVMEQLGFHSQE